MDNEKNPLTWEDLRSSLMNNTRTQDLISHLKSREYVSAEELFLLNVLMQEGASARSNEIADRTGSRMADASWAAASAEKTTSRFTEALKKATNWLAAATTVLAISAVADIVLRFLFQK